MVSYHSAPLPDMSHMTIRIMI